MSNDTNYKIKIRGKTSNVDEALTYLDLKFQRWQDYQNKGVKYTRAHCCPAISQTAPVD
jgi:hypothetical protein